MPDTAKRLAGPSQLSTTIGTAYTVPSGTTTIIRHMHFQNPSASTVTLTVAVDADGSTTDVAAERFYDALDIPPGESLDWSGFLVLTAAEELLWKCGTATTIVGIVSGIEVTPGPQS